MNSSYDVAVVGLGTMGSFACCELARRGLRVVGLDRFIPPHGRGSHSGDTRVFRIAYAEHPDYVPLAVRASKLWDDYSALGNSQLLTRCGVLSIGARDGDFIAGIRKSAAIHGLETISYTRDEIRRKFPAFAPQENHVGVFEPKAGWIDSNAAIEIPLRLAKRYGSTLLLEEPALGWTPNAGGFEVSTASGSIIAEKLVITAGAWANQLLDELGLPLRVERKVLTWVDPMEPSLFQPDAFPVFVCDENFFYGFPAIGGQGVKLAVHWKPGQQILDPTESVAEPSADDAAEPLAIAAKLLPRLAGNLPEALKRVRQMKTCLYTMSHDEHFFVDRHPEWPGVVFAAGFSGHGFKFAPAIGEALADLVTENGARLPIGFLSTSRLAAQKH